MRAFIAIEIPDKIKEEILKVSQEFSSTSTLVKKDVIHITLHFLGDIDEHGADIAQTTLEELEQKKFAVHIKGLGSFPDSHGMPRIVFANITEGEYELRDIYNTVSQKLKRAKLKFEEEDDYAPHITIARIKKPEKQTIESLIAKHTDVNFGSFIVESVMLKQSVLTPEGPVYSDIYKRKLL